MSDSNKIDSDEDFIWAMNEINNSGIPIDRLKKRGTYLMMFAILGSAAIDKAKGENDKSKP